MCAQSLLQKARLDFKPKLPPVLETLHSTTISSTEKTPDISSELSQIFPQLNNSYLYLLTKGRAPRQDPLKVGVVLSGGQAPGGHNVISGLYDALKKINTKSRLFGFLNGPKGIIDNEYIEITAELLASYRNQGGFDIIGSGRDKIESTEQFQSAEKVVKELNLDGLVIIGGDDSNTNAAFLANAFASTGCKTKVVGIPKTIDGDLKNDHVEISFGFDTATKTYSDIIGNLMRDALSAKKYYYFVKLMGRSASHVALECALQTHPNLALIGEEIVEKKQTLAAVVNSIADIICQRADAGKNYGVILIPEGLIEFIVEIRTLITELNTILAKDKPHDVALGSLSSKEEKVNYVAKLLSPESLSCFKILPTDIQNQLLLSRDAHGNVQVSKIETERMLIDMVKKELKERTKKGIYKGSFSPQPHFCGYEGRSCLPSNFDCQYCYALGHIAAVLINEQVNGYMASIKNLDQDTVAWQIGAVPLTCMMTAEKRHGKNKFVVKKALVDLGGPVFKEFAHHRESWILQDDYIYPGPIQFFGPDPIVNAITKTLSIESHL